MDGCWRDDGKCLNGSIWQLIERGSRVATLCNLLAVPWCMQAWYQHAWQTLAGMREQWGEASLCFHRLRCKKERRLFDFIFYCQGKTNRCSNFLHCANSRLASSTPFREIILSLFSWRLLADLLSAAATRLLSLNKNLGISLLITMLCWCGTYSLFPFVCDKVSPSGLLTWDWSRMPWQMSAIITREPDHTHKSTNIHISPD